MTSHSEAKSFRDLLGVSPSIVSPSTSTLLIIDAQNEYASGQLKTANISSTRSAISSLLTTYRKSSKPENIIHITHQVPEGAPVFTPGTELAKEFEELEPREGEKVVKKSHPGSFTGTDLGSYLQKKDSKQVVLAGYMAHVCVSTTARQAAERGLDVILAKEVGRLPFGEVGRRREDTDEIIGYWRSRYSWCKG